MIQLVGIKKNIDIEIREKLALHSKKQENYTKELLNYFDEVVIISTCNRTEIYFNGSLSGEEGLKKVFEIFKWDINLSKYCFYLDEKETVKHLMEVVCGFHSRILGEDQILGQIKSAYQKSLEMGAVKLELQRLFQDAITCGKRFRTEGRLYEIPVSSSSIAVNDAINKGAKKFMVIGYGEVGTLVVKYALSHNIDSLKLVVRDITKIEYIDDIRVEVMDYKHGREIINDMDCVISCTSAPHLIIEQKHIKEYGDRLIIFDLAVPRDVDEKVKNFNRVELLDIDDISSIDDENKKLRDERMQYFKYIPYQYIKEFLEWKKLRGIAQNIKELKISGNKVVEERCKTFSHKCKNPQDIQLANVLIKSTSDAYVNRAIEVLKEEKLKGCEEECLRILKRIFQI
ncbi:glutamyl-tRNA reductase [Clostridium septicum]|uniref:Glutamyl-tRNA reductase n=1 Tax=Clostridium septicum TaxID=1504 RepID=A0A9N7JK58_CLOSE|nr:glutamyl-tRNA reductase [Clostridium septicum]AYE33545.1 glutamyl-tRNA reductase [Clostridium septicum]MDU1313819.1 glutamyl-tRNA reductase [Clostridium septicum]QAS61708.1 glutamyl-tRNA reductase [Clostridium septicum]UEC21845.1 glutamyl-tRNA reductase [Clostridium septicum]USS00102.1 glutamyl-tRNA reductase [Clostridium septicum]